MEHSQEKYNPLHNQHISGLGGWLILAQISLWSTVVSFVINIFFNILPIFRTDQWNNLTDPTSMSYNKMWPIVIPYELIGSSLLLGALIYAFVLFYRKKRQLPKWLKYYYLAYGVYTLVDFFLVRAIPEIQDVGVTNPLVTLIRTLVICAIWISYYGISVRVRNTFIK
ncbi:DUF2569 domain-containing protein [Paenibacillus solisilvae]|uniref:DUF2569 domain-containing protein n=1 Tax=Paenibacillus solisilvae TaxID=2486751 RepID=A0ABW0W569_9BACL